MTETPHPRTLRDMSGVESHTGRLSTTTKLSEPPHAPRYKLPQWPCGVAAQAQIAPCGVKLSAMDRGAFRTKAIDSSIEPSSSSAPHPATPPRIIRASFTSQWQRQKISSRRTSKTPSTGRRRSRTEPFPPLRRARTIRTLISPVSTTALSQRLSPARFQGARIAREVSDMDCTPNR